MYLVSYYQEIIENSLTLGIIAIAPKSIARQLSYYRHENHILNPYQSAYTNNKSSETAIIHILNHIHLSSASPHGSVIILLDLSA